MTYQIKAVHFTLLLALLVLAGCFSLARDEPPQQHYVLGGSRLQETEGSAERLAGVRIGLRRLQLAGYLTTPRIVVRHGLHEIRYAEFHRWGEDLGGGVNRALAGHLAAQASFEVIDVAPWPPQSRHDYLIQLHLQRFEGQVPEEPAASEGEASLLAIWEIIDPQDGAVLARGTTDFRAGGWVVGDYDGLVALLDTGLRELSDDLVEGLENLVAP
ncbi:MAG: PqiC family protein [Rhodothermales bacterium]